VSIGDGATVRVSQKLTADISALAIDPDIFGNNFGTLSYQWYRDGAAINGANSKTYIVRLADSNKQITFDIKSSTCAGSVISNSVAVLPRVDGDAEYVLDASKDDEQISCDLINFTEKSTNVSLLLAVYNSDKKLVKVFSSNLLEIKGEGEISYAWDVNMADYRGCTMKVFAWDKEFVPLSKDVTLN
jgi:hypothetical protein